MGDKILELNGKIINRDQLITVGDLLDFKESLLKDIRTILSDSKNSTKIKKWLKSHEVLKLLNISRGTLHALRTNALLPFTRLGGVLYYDADDIQAVLESRQENRSTAA